MKKALIFIGSSIGSLLLAGGVLAQDITRLGGDLTSEMPLTAALELPAPTVPNEMFLFHLDGHTEFHKPREAERLNGKPLLGPFFNHDSCGGCHFKDGRGAIGFPHRPPGSAMLVKVSLRGFDKNGQVRNLPGFPEQLQDHSVAGTTRFNIKLRWRQRVGKYPDGTEFQIRSPNLSFDIPGVDPKRVVSSLRSTPPVVGMGLLEAIPVATILALGDPDDANGDGISGRPRFVPNRETNTIELGRFGFRASHPTVKQQSAAAFFNDMGMTNELFSKKGVPQEVSSEAMAKLVFYQQTPGIPPARDQSDPDVMAGKALFQQVGCNACHIMTLHTGASEVVEVANQEIHPFTDLLLHDMGLGLADRRAEPGVNGHEWRTSPLWGIGLHKFLTNARPGFLHDGRARSIEEAILWHSGESAESRKAFMALSLKEREQLIRFVDSL